MYSSYTRCFPVPFHGKYDDDDDEEGRNYEDDRVYGVGSQTLMPDESEDEDEDDDDDFSEDEGQRIEVRRRRPSESLARNTSQHAAVDNR